MFRLTWLLGFFLAFQLKNIANSAISLKMTNLVCESNEKSFAEFKFCRVKSINRTTESINMELKLLKLPVNDLHMRVKGMYRANGWKPFLYDITFDLCQQLSRYSHPITKLILSCTRNYTNAPSKCPFTETRLYTENYTNTHIAQCLKSLPVPEGEYAALTTWFSNNSQVFKIDFYAKLSYNF